MPTQGDPVTISTPYGFLREALMFVENTCKHGSDALGKEKATPLLVLLV